MSQEEDKMAGTQVDGVNGIYKGVITHKVSYKAKNG